jgi:hypothetical protein
VPASLTAALAAAVVAALWLLGRRRPSLIRNADTSAVAALNRAQIALVQAGGGKPAAEQTGAAGAESKGLLVSVSGRPESPGSPREQARPATLELPNRRATHEVLRFRATLRTHYNQGGTWRLEAIRAARHWGDRSTLPLLRQALRDPDPAVVREAAAAIERFRGGPSRSRRETPQSAAPPRKVARTR